VGLAWLWAGDASLFGLDFISLAAIIARRFNACKVAGSSHLIMVKNHVKQARRRRSRMAERADRHSLYEAAVQCVEAEIDFIDAEFKRLRGRRARVLREDFCGTGNAACEWVKRRANNRAIGVDLDGTVMAWGQRHHVEKLAPAARKRVALVQADVLRADSGPVDAVLAMNFSYWIFKQRALLRRYFRRVRRALVDDGVFFLDCFGGYEAFQVQKEYTVHKRFTYTWEHAAYNPINGDFLCHIHFSFPDGSRLERAFTYDWRLWTLPELREVLAEAGFRRTTVYWQGWDDTKHEASGEFAPAEVGAADAGWICYIAAEK